MTVEERDPSLRPRCTAGPTIHAYALRLRGIRFEANVGATAEERSARQELVVDVDVSLSARALPKRDLLSETVDYDRVVRSVVEESSAESYRLLETCATRIVSRLLAELPALTVRVAVTKKKVPTAYPVESAVVELVGSRSSGQSFPATAVLNPPFVRRTRERSDR